MNNERRRAARDKERPTNSRTLVLAAMLNFICLSVGEASFEERKEGKSK